MAKEINKRDLNTRDLAQIALFAALTAVGAFIRVPLPLIPFTLQTFFVSLSGALLGARRGMLASCSISPLASGDTRIHKEEA